MKANEDPKYAGILPLVINKYVSVPIPDVVKAVLAGNPVKIGTNTVAPNIANKCCKLNVTHRAKLGFSWTSRIGFTLVFSAILLLLFLYSNFHNYITWIVNLKVFFSIFFNLF